MSNRFNSKSLRAFLFASLALSITISGCGKKPQSTVTAKPEAQPETKLFDYRHIELDNGMDVITLEDFSCPIVACQVWYKIGSKDENPERQGFAHMFEHMMFKGTDRVGPKDHFAFIQRVGGNNNAYTSFDKTVYTQTLPSDQLELAMWLEAERMAFLKIDQNSFDTERKVVEEELRMGENRPYGTLFKKQFAALFSTHPYKWMPIGKVEHIRAFSVPELRAFWTKYYVPSNATLVIVGAVKHEDAQKMAEKYFGWIPTYPVPERVKTKEPKQTEPRELIIDDENAPAGMLDIVWKTVPAGHDNEVVLDLLGNILGGGNSSRLYRDLVADNQIAVDASASAFSLEQAGIFSVNTVQSPGSDFEAIKQAIWKHIEKIKTDGVTEEELNKARNQMLKSVVTTNLTVESKASLLGNAAVVEGDISNVNKMLDEINAVTIQDIQTAANQYLTANKSLTMIVKQNMKGARAGVKDAETMQVTAPREEVAPPPGREGAVRPDSFPAEAPVKELAADNQFDKYEPTVLANGLKVVVVPNNEVPFVSVSLGLLSGAWTEQEPGTASMALGMLTKGTAKYNEAELAKELEQYAISLAGKAEMDTSTVSMNCLVGNIDRAMDMMAQVVLEPTFDEAEFAKLQNQTLTELRIQSQTPRYLADRELRRRLFGSHPYARSAAGEIADVEALTPAGLKQWWQTFAGPNVATLIFAGDIDKDQAVALAEKAFGSWKTQVILPALEIAAPNNPTETHIYIVDRPGSMQSEIRIAQIAFTRHQQPDYFVSKLVTHYFGGQFNSRLNEAVRVKKGLTYGAQGYFSSQARAGTFKMSTFTKNESTGETLSTMFEELDRLQSDPPLEKELTDGQSFFVGSFPANHETPQQIAKELWLVQSQDLGSDYLENLLNKVTTTTADECIDLAKRILDPKKMTVVITGDAAKIKTDLEKIAPVTVIKENQGKDL